MKLWGRINSINVKKVLWTLDELGLEYEQINVGGEFGGLDSEEYLAMNPNGKIPTLEDEGFVLWESNVIVRYLAECYGEDGLLPDDYYDRVLANQWMDWQQNALNADISYLLFGMVRLLPTHQNPQEQARCVERLNHNWGALEYWLNDREYIVANRLTMADIPLGCAAYRWHSLGIEHLHFPNIARWYANLHESSAFNQHVAIGV